MLVLNMHIKQIWRKQRLRNTMLSSSCAAHKHSMDTCSFCWNFYRTVLSCFMILTLLSCCVNAGYDFPDSRQAELVNILKECHITVPVRVTPSGHYLSHNLHHIIRRNTEASDVHYKISLPDRDVHVSLRPNNKLVSPGMVVERRKNRYGNATDFKLSKKGYNDCHFMGDIHGEKNSLVALSTCNGLNGVIMTQGGHYFIEPVKGHNTTREPHHPHIIYKHEHLPVPHHKHHHDKHKESNDDFCGVEGSEINHVDTEKQRSRWEEHVRKNKSSHRRHKRSISSERNVETLVVVDPKMMNYYKDEDIETYVMTIMNMVSTMYHDASIGNAVNINLVRMMLLEEDEKDLQISHHADNTLASFCKWQKNVNPKDDSHPNHHDVAVLLTRYNICSRMNQPCSTLGLAQVSGMCQPHRSCNVNEDTGLALAYTVAHEIGHNFGMKHDSYTNGCIQPSGDRRYVMSPQLHVDTSPLLWSNCSRADITKFLDRDWGYCLEDEPIDHDFDFPVLPPGVMYDANHQCRLQYGQDAEYCDGIEDICQTLWCRVDNKCMTRVESAAEGTLCEQEDYFNSVSTYGITPKKWCFAGQCVTIGDRPEAINGEWSQWGSWSECTRTCGAGVTYAERLCDNPPPSNGGKYCLGERKRFRICNTDPCPEGFPSFHDVQCQEFNYIPYKNGLYEWEHVPTPDVPCQLHCKPKNRFFHVMLKDIVSDGTQCKPGTRNMCISGRCRHVGCDWNIDSDAKEDRCGVCHGDGSACKTVKAQFKGQQGLGYVEATVIPTGARNIRIEEVAAANNYIALRNDRGEYLLNGHWFIQWSGDYRVAGSTIHYERDGNKEKLFALGPLKEPVHVMLLFQSHNPGVVFEYTVPNENATEERKPEFAWKFSEWTHCTSSCGGGTQYSMVVCTEKEAGVIDNGYCRNLTKPDDKLSSCNTHLCPARWWAGPWQHCSVTCGKNGIHKRTVICVRSFGPDHQIALEDHECEDQIKPKEYDLCHHKDPCPDEVHWEAGPWSDTCLDDPCATQTRTVQCSDGSLSCGNKPKPSEIHYCTNIICGSWDTGAWAECTRSCGGGIQFRKVMCSAGTACPRIEEPASERICNMFDCPTTPSIDVSTHMLVIKESNVISSETTALHTTAVPWEHENISEMHIKSFNNTSEVFKKGDTILTDLIPVESMEETITETVATQNLSVNHSLNIKEYDGSDHTERVSTNHDEHHHKHHHGRQHHNNTSSPTLPVVPATSPAISEADQTSNQSGHLKPDKNSELLLDSSATNNVGAGLEISGPLKHYNLYEDVSLRENIEASTLVPEMSDLTTTLPQFKWLPLFWEACDKKCGGGVRQRNLICMSQYTLQEVEQESCRNIPKLRTEEPCNQQPCMGWQASEWEQCSQTCGNGTQHRQVFCPLLHMCDPVGKPAEKRICNTQPCIAWMSGAWSKCSKTCGGGEHARHVQCIDLLTDRPAHGCNSLQMPSETKTCNMELCEIQNAALQDRFANEPKEEDCKNDRMRHSICLQLKHKGQCAHRYIALQCCRTCMIHKKRGEKMNSSRR